MNARAAALLYALCIAACAAAADYPSRPIRLVAVGAPGGTPDILSRRLGGPLSEVFGVQIVVDNRASFGGIATAELVAKAPADGYTLYMTYHQHTVNASLVAKLPYRPVEDFTAVTQLTAAALVLVVHPSAPVSNMREFIEWTKAMPTPASFGSAGVGSGGHMAGELYKMMTGVKAQHVPYKSASASLIDLAANQYQFNFAGMQTVQAYLRTGRLKAIAVTSLKRNTAMPDTPTVSESALPGFEIVGWYGMLAPAGLPKPVLTRINTEVVRIAQTQAFRNSVSADGSEIVTNTPEEFRAFLVADVAKWAKIMKDSGAKLE